MINAFNFSVTKPVLKKFIKKPLGIFGILFQKFGYDYCMFKSDNKSKSKNLMSDYLNYERQKPIFDNDFTISEYSHKIILFGYILVKLYFI